MGGRQYHFQQNLIRPDGHIIDQFSDHGPSSNALSACTGGSTIGELPCGQGPQFIPLRRRKYGQVLHVLQRC